MEKQKNNILIISSTINCMSTMIISIGLLVSIISVFLIISSEVDPIIGQEDDQQIEPIPPVNLTNQTSSQVSTEIIDSMMNN